MVVAATMDFKGEVGCVGYVFVVVVVVYTDNGYLAVCGSRLYCSLGL